MRPEGASGNKHVPRAASSRGRRAHLHPVVVWVSLRRVQLLVVQVEHTVCALHLLRALLCQQRRPPLLHSTQYAGGGAYGSLGAQRRGMRNRHAVVWHTIS